MQVNIGEKSQDEKSTSNIEYVYNNYQPKRSGNSYSRYNSSNTFYNKRRQDYRWIVQILISGVILLVIAGVYKLNIPFTGPLKNTINYLMNTEVNVQPVFSKIVQLASQQGNMEWPLIDDIPHSSVNDASAPVSSDFTLSLPVSGKVSLLYGWTVQGNEKIQVFHQGIDIDVPVGTEVKAAAKGRVIKTGEDKTLGQYILIENTSGDIVRYAGLSEILVEKDQVVKAAEVIAKTGYCEGENPHLHFEVFVNGKPVDPLGKLGLNLSGLKSDNGIGVDDKNRP